MTMKPTFVERLILSNQYRILEQLYPKERKDFAKAREIFEEGYESEYGSVTGHITDDKDVITPEISHEVHDILTMFEQLARVYKGLKDKAGISKDSLAFAGFDGNDPLEIKYMVYTRRLLDKKQRMRYATSVTRADDGGNSHTPRLQQYREMVRKWQASANRNELTKEDIIRITKD